MKVLVRVPLSPYSGYGKDGIGMVQALARRGCDVYVKPLHVDAPLPGDVAALLTKPLVGPFDLHILHADPSYLDGTSDVLDACRVNVAWTMWEYTTMDNLPAPVRRTMRKRLKKFDVVLGYDSVTVAALAAFYDGPKAVVQGGYVPSGWEFVDRDWSGRFGFAMVGALDDRKDPFVAIEAFRELKAEYPVEFEPAELHVKTIVPGVPVELAEYCPKLRVHYAAWSTELLKLFYAQQHCLLAPSRGEGKNLPALEFLSTGGTVIATNWGGHTGWLHPGYGYPLDYVLRPVAAKFPDCLNARASKRHLKELMLEVFRNRDTARDKGAVAASAVPFLCSWDRVFDRFFAALSEVEPTYGVFADVGVEL